MLEGMARRFQDPEAPPDERHTHAPLRKSFVTRSMKEIGNLTGQTIRYNGIGNHSVIDWYTSAEHNAQEVRAQISAARYPIDVEPMILLIQVIQPGSRQARSAVFKVAQ